MISIFIKTDTDGQFYSPVLEEATRETKRSIIIVVVPIILIEFSVMTTSQPYIGSFTYIVALLVVWIPVTRKEII